MEASGVVVGEVVTDFQPSFAAKSGKLPPSGSSVLSRLQNDSVWVGPGRRCRNSCPTGYAPCYAAACVLRLSEPRRRASALKALSYLRRLSSDASLLLTVITEEICVLLLSTLPRPPHRPMRVLPTPMATATPASRLP